MGELIATGRGDFYVERTGQKGEQTLVFVAGLGDDHASWAEVAEDLAAAYDCVTFDNRGIGQSPVTPGPYSIAQMAEDAHELVRTLGTGSVVAIGSSMGGAICQEWALAHPEAITHLVLTNTWAERDEWLRSLLDHWLDLAERGCGPDLLYQLALFCFSPDYLSAHPGTVDEFLAAPLPDLSGLAAAGRACQEHHTIDRLGGIDIPTLVIGGEHDILTRPELSTRLAAALPGAELRWLPAGHMIFWEQPAAWASLVREFLGAP